MLRNANPHDFAGIYIICGFTDMRYGIDTLAAIIENRYHLSLFVPDTLFLFCGKRTNKIKGLLWEGDGFLLLTKRVEEGRYSNIPPGQSARQSRQNRTQKATSTGYKAQG